jgi:hypothetical protein
MKQPTTMNSSPNPGRIHEKIFFVLGDACRFPTGGMPPR